MPHIWTKTMEADLLTQNYVLHTTWRRAKNAACCNGDDDAD